MPHQKNSTEKQATNETPNIVVLYKMLPTEQKEALRKALGIKTRKTMERKLKEPGSFGYGPLVKAAEYLTEILEKEYTAEKLMQPNNAL